jgi:hypothetical protein
MKTLLPWRLFFLYQDGVGPCIHANDDVSFVLTFDNVEKDGRELKLDGIERDVFRKRYMQDARRFAGPISINLFPYLHDIAEECTSTIKNAMESTKVEASDRR